MWVCHYSERWIKESGVSKRGGTKLCVFGVPTLSLVGLSVLTILSYVVGRKFLKDAVVEGDVVNDESILNADAKAKEEKGVPSFCLNAMRNNEILTEEFPSNVPPTDEECNSKVFQLQVQFFGYLGVH
ncbi:hypothetical protein E3N88_23083 [Mikania micrantha]|uniref:Uncharacterized protein n=1 Tax=Mikania micrantha TaxID=192012 RepID=A0A5N6NCB3_9ASTR|nr:hypothetical protein E3N88_23083 [Mikania micrantha]